MEPIVEAEGLIKRFDAFEAVRGIDFSIPAGMCFGLLGPNGSGKTTTVRMVHCVTPPSAGRLRVFGMGVAESPREIKARIGVCAQEETLDSDFTVRRNLEVFARYFGISSRRARERAGELIEFFQLEAKSAQKIETLSGGLKRRLQIARALVNEPDLLILDEPTTGLDPQARHQIWEMVRQLKRRGLTVILTTHYMEEASMLCDELAFMGEGRIVERGAPKALIERHVGRDVLEIEETSEALEGWLTEHGESWERVGERLHVRTADGRPLLARLTEERLAQHVTLRHATLEDVFLKLTGRHLNE